MIDVSISASVRFAAAVAVTLVADDLAGMVQACPGTLSWYEAQLIDELEDPIPGVLLAMTTPIGTVILPTSGDGVVRIALAPAGTGTMQIQSVPQCALVMQGWQDRDRRKVKLPDPADLFQLTTLTRADKSYSFPDAQRFVLMLVTRPDFTHNAETPGWSDRALVDDSGPWTAVLTDTNSVAMFSDATGSAWQVNGPPASGTAPDALPAEDRQPQPTPPGDSADTGWFDVQAVAWPSLAADDPPVWLTATVDQLHDALFDGDFDTAGGILDQVSRQPPPPATPDWPTPDGEAAAFYNLMVELASQGEWDPAKPEDDDDADPTPDPVAQP